MTQEPPQSWPPGDPGPGADRPMAFDPLTGEPIPASSGSGVDLTKPEQPTAGAPRSEGGYPSSGEAGYPSPGDGAQVPGYPAPGYGPAGHPAPGYGPGGYPPPDHGPVGYPPPGYGAAGYPPPGYGPAGYPPPGYGMAPYPPAYPVARPTNGLAITSLVLGAVWVFWLGSVLALVLGYVARGQIRRTGEGGDGVAVAGIVLGWVGVGFLLLLVVLGVLGDS